MPPRQAAPSLPPLSLSAYCRSRKRQDKPPPTTAGWTAPVVCQFHLRSPVAIDPPSNAALICHPEFAYALKNRSVPTEDIANGAPQAICDVLIGNVRRDLLVNRDKPPFDNPELRHAMSLAIDHQAFIDILYQGEGTVGGAMLPAPDGLWGMPPDMLKRLPGYDPDVAKNRAEAKKIME